MNFNKSFYIGDKVQIKLTEYGISYLKKEYEKLKKEYPSLNLGEFKEPEIDKDGFSTWTMHKIITTFGDGAFIASNIVSFTNMRFAESSLKSI